MGTPNSTSIVNYLVTQLGTITVAGGYKTTVAEVTRYGRNPDEAPRRPSLDVHKGPVDYTYVHGNQLRCTMAVHVFGHVYGDTEAARLIAVENLLDDCIAALFSDPTCSSEAIDLTIRRSEDNVSDLPSLRTNQGLGADLVIELQVRWDRTTSLS